MPWWDEEDEFCPYCHLPLNECVCDDDDRDEDERDISDGDGFLA